jgi:hypothetical protein
MGRISRLDSNQVVLPPASAIAAAARNSRLFIPTRCL